MYSYQIASDSVNKLQSNGKKKIVKNDIEEDFFFQKKKKHWL